MRAVVAAVLATATIVSVTACSDPADDPEVLKYDAIRVCKDWVKDQLKAPATADFSEEVATGYKTEFTVKGNVDAENSFGAKIRNTWTCSVRLDGETWRGNAKLNS